MLTVMLMVLFVLVMLAVVFMVSLMLMGFLAADVVRVAGVVVFGINVMRFLLCSCHCLWYINDVVFFVDDDVYTLYLVVVWMLLCVDVCYLS